MFWTGCSRCCLTRLIVQCSSFFFLIKGSSYHLENFVCLHSNNSKIVHWYRLIFILKIREKNLKSNLSKRKLVLAACFIERACSIWDIQVPFVFIFEWLTINTIKKLSNEEALIPNSMPHRWQKFFDYPGLLSIIFKMTLPSKFRSIELTVNRKDLQMTSDPLFQVII